MSKRASARFQLPFFSRTPPQAIRGILFDLDGTVESRSRVRLVALVASIPFLRRLPPLRQVCTVEPEKQELFGQLRRAGIRLGIVTNGLPYKRRAIQALNLNTYMDCVVISSKIGARKPDPTIFQQAASRIGLPPAQILFVGDSVRADMQGARQTGMRTMLICDSRRRRQRKQPTADLVGRSILDLRSVLGLAR